MASDLRERLGVPLTTPLIEAVYNDPDPFFSHPLAIAVTKKDITEGKQRDHENCAIACALRNSNNVQAACVQSRAVYLVRRYPRDGVNTEYRGKTLITKHHLSEKSSRLVKKFDRNPTKVPSGYIDVIPLALSHKASVRKEKRGTGVPRGHGHKQKKARRPTWLRSRLAPRVSA